jgi:3-isopropylmalate/(R)-2-methylmalate dehydratase small subunit
MTQPIRSTVYVVGDDVDTDQIIPARHLAIPLDDPAQRARYGGLAFTGVPSAGAGLPDGGVRFADPDDNRSEFRVVIAGSNFGCGSSREHAPVALTEAGVLVVVAVSYARIFYRNAVDGGYFPPLESEQNLSSEIKTGDCVVVDVEKGTVLHEPTEIVFRLRPLGAAAEIVEAGGIFEYARRRGMV